MFSTDIEEARDTALRFLKTELWEVREEKDVFSPTQERIDGLADAEASSYRTAESVGIHATFNYWHK